MAIRHTASNSDQVSSQFVACTYLFIYYEFYKIKNIREIFLELKKSRKNLRRKLYVL